MSRRALKLAVVILAACAAEPGDEHPSLNAARPASADEVCSDARVGKTFGGDPAGCREYLDACLSELTDAQRTEWRRSVNSCLQSSGALYSCYAEVPWC